MGHGLVGMTCELIHWQHYGQVSCSLHSPLLASAGCVSCTCFPAKCLGTCECRLRVFRFLLLARHALLSVAVREAVETVAVVRGPPAAIQ